MRVPMIMIGDWEATLNSYISPYYLSWLLINTYNYFSKTWYEYYDRIQSWDEQSITTKYTFAHYCYKNKRILYITLYTIITNYQPSMSEATYTLSREVIYHTTRWRVLLNLFSSYIFLIAVLCWVLSIILYYTFHRWMMRSRCWIRALFRKGVYNYNCYCYFC